nr:hypothetical protein [Bradyrhizobium sp. 2S1]
MPALAAVPPLPLWSAMSFAMVSVWPLPGAKLRLLLPWMKMPEPYAEPLAWPMPLVPPATALKSESFDSEPLLMVSEPPC